MTITYDTPIESLLDVEKVKESLENYEQIAFNRSNQLYESIEVEQKIGLSSDAFQMDDNPLLYEKSELIKKSIEDVDNELITWKNTVLKQAKDKRQEELTELKRKVKAKVNELLIELVKARVSAMIKKPPTNIEELEKKYNYYTNKYEILLKLE